MRSFHPPTDVRPSQKAGTTIRLADYQTQPTTRTSWSEVQIHREEIRLPQGQGDKLR